MKIWKRLAARYVPDKALTNMTLEPGWTWQPVPPARCSHTIYTGVRCKRQAMPSGTCALHGGHFTQPVLPQHMNGSFWFPS